MRLKNPFVLFIIVFIWGYKVFLSPILGNNCRFEPSCSLYALDSFKKYGLIKGFFLSLRRIGKCHPWGGSGYDPVP